MKENIKSNFGVPRDLFAKFKFYFLYLPDLIILGVGIFGGVTLMSVFPVSQWINMIACIVLVISLSIFLVLQSNGGKRNYEIIIFYLRQKTKHKNRKIKMLDIREGE
ncbi:hypothetical protein ACFSJM_08670 [Lactococcus formosensis subsp. bovis]|uniref:hypothetical protein n=1 Tax=Lactococcus TaxID=1357 RepID=UPI001BCCB1BF|nr:MULTISPECIES: hypothetical protein [Lactococcus]